MQKALFSLKGFTLIELLVVISIIGLISTVAVVGVNNARAKGRDGVRKGDLSQFKKALEIYYNGNNQQYPPSPDTGQFSCTDTNVPAGLGTYIKPIPIDPLVYRGPSAGIGGLCLNYRSDGYNYKVRVNLELDSDTMIGDGGVSASWYELFSPGAQPW